MMKTNNSIYFPIKNRIDTSAGTAIESDILNGKIAYVDDKELIGTGSLAIPLTQAEYDALDPKDDNTYYLIIGEAA